MQLRFAIALLLTGIAALAGAALAAVAGHSGGGAPVVAPRSPFDGALAPPGDRAPAFALHDQYGRPIRMADFRGRPTIVTFLYTTCRQSCPAEAQQIKGALDDLGHDLPAVAISVDPAHDTPASARHFLAEQGMGARIRFALGTRAELAALWRAYAVTPQKPHAEHMSLIVLVDRRGFQRVTYPQSQTTPERLAHDLRVLERS